MAIEVEDLMDIAPLGETVTPEEIEDIPSLDGFGETVTPEEIEQAVSLDGLGRLTPEEAGQVNKLQRQAAWLRWNPIARLRLLRTIRAIQGRAGKRERKVVKVAKTKAKIAATPEIVLGPVSAAAIIGLPIEAIKRRAAKKAADQKRLKEKALRQLQTRIIKTTAEAAEAKVKKQTDRVARLTAKVKGLQKAAANLAAAKIRLKTIVRKATERQRVVRAMAGGAPAIAKYGARRFAEGKATAGGVFQKAMTREFMGPDRVQ